MQEDAENAFIQRSYSIVKHQTSILHTTNKRFSHLVPLMEINTFGFLFSHVIFWLSPLDVVGRVSIDVPPVVTRHYWLNADEAGGALDSCQIIQLRKVADTRFHPEPRQFIFILLSEPLWWDDGAAPPATVGG